MAIIEIINACKRQKSLFIEFIDTVFAQIKYLFKEFKGDIVQKMNVALVILIMISSIIFLIIGTIESAKDAANLYFIYFFVGFIFLWVTIIFCKKFTQHRY